VTECVLVTGASGFIGRHALASLRDRGHEVVAVSRAGGPRDDGVRWERADLLDARDRHRVIAAARATRLLHLAWVTEPGVYWTSPDNERWVAASLDLVRRFAAEGGHRAVVAGSCAEYEWSQPLLSESQTPLRPATPYGRAKHELHESVDEFARGQGLTLAWARLFFLYGPGEHRDRLVASITRALLASEPIETTDGLQRRDFLYGPDASDAIVALLDSGAEGALNIAAGESVSVREIVESIGRATGRPELIRFGAIARDPSDPPELVADVARLRREVGWCPRVSLPDGIEATVAWWRDRLG
jgi:nucleoside-diphosphate-sugar epimerase